MSENIAALFMALVLVLLLLAIGYAVGESFEQGRLLTAYCQSVEYQGYTRIDGLAYCYDDGRLLAIEWSEE